MNNVVRITFILWISFFSRDISAKIRVLTFHYNKPDFIELQARTCKEFLLDDYEIIVFNDAKDVGFEIQIRDMCERHEIQCIRFQQEWHRTDPLNEKVKEWLDDPAIYSHIQFNGFLGEVPYERIESQPSLRHCHVIQYALDNYGYDHDDVVVILDGDAFFIRPINLKKLLRRNQILGIEKLIDKENVSYLWVPFIAFNPQNLPNVRSLRFDVAVVGNKMYDTGAQSYYYLKNNPKVRVKKIPGYSSSTFHHFSEDQIACLRFSHYESWLIKTLPWPNTVEFHLNHHILHFAGSSFDLEGHDVKSDYVKIFLEKILK